MSGRRVRRSAVAAKAVDAAGPSRSACSSSEEHQIIDLTAGSADENASQASDSRKRQNSPVASAAKRMRLLACACEDEVTRRSEEGEQEDDPTVVIRDDSGDCSDAEDARTAQTQDEEYDGTDEECMDDDDEAADVNIEEDDDDDDMMVVERTTIETSDDGDDIDSDYFTNRFEANENQENESISNTSLLSESDNVKRMLAFRELSVKLEQRREMMPLKEPALLTKRCRGVGPAAEVWSLLCYKDELYAISDARFLAKHNITGEARATLIDWMMEVCQTTTLHRDTFHLAVDYVDRCLANGPAMGMNVPLNKFQLLGTTALFIAAKYEEIYPPKLEDFVAYTDGACSPEMVRGLEMQMLKVLQWELNIVTSIHWMHLFLQLMGLPDDEKEIKKSPLRNSNTPNLKSESDDGHYVECVDQPGPERPATVPHIMRDEFMHMAQILDIAILHAESRQFTNRQLAAAVIFLIYAPVSFVESITGINARDPLMARCIQFMEPIVIYAERNRPSGDPLPFTEGVRPEDVHNIQTYRIVCSEEETIKDILDRIVDIGRELQKAKLARSNTTPVRPSPLLSSSSTPKGTSQPQPRSAAIRLKK